MLTTSHEFAFYKKWLLLTPLQGMILFNTFGRLKEQRQNVKCMFLPWKKKQRISPPPPNQEPKPLCIVQVEVMQCGGKKKKESSPICRNFPVHVWGLSFSNNSNSRQSTNHRVIFHHQLPTCSTPVSSDGARWHVEGKATEGVRDIGEDGDIGETCCRWAERVYRVRDMERCELLLRKKTLRSFYLHGVWVQSDNVKSWTPGSPWRKGGWSMCSSIRGDQQFTSLLMP